MNPSDCPGHHLTAKMLRSSGAGLLRQTCLRSAPSFRVGSLTDVMVVLSLSLAIAGCGGPSLTAPSSVPSKKTLPITLMSAADLGIVSAKSGLLVRIAKIENRSESSVGVSRWRVSCECLSVAPASLQLGPGESVFIALVYDPAKEGGEFTGNLLISVEALSGDAKVCEFGVPVSVVAAKDVAHLDELIHAVSGQSRP